MSDPGLWRARWLSELDEFTSITRRRLAELRRESSLDGVSPRARERLLRMISGIERQHVAVTERLSPLRGTARWLPNSAIPTRPGPTRTVAVLHCYEHIFRDWAWGERESNAALSLVLELMAEETPKRLAVYGSGAGRLARDVHRALSPNVTLALDQNPLPTFVAAELVRGNKVLLDEFPVAPHSAESVVVTQELSAGDPVPEGLVFAIADALRPPLLPGSLDAVITPWFIDAVEADLRDTAASIQRVLAPSGLWVNSGPLRFQGDLSGAFMIEEVHEIVEQSGFELVSRLTREVPYFASPHSGFRREETVFGFMARKRGQAPERPLPSLELPWIENPTLPIPKTPDLEAQRRASLFHLSILSQVDGQRSISELAGSLAAQWNVDAVALRDQLRAYFARRNRSPGSDQ